MLNHMSGLGEAPYSSRVYRRTRRVYEYILVLYIFFMKTIYCLYYAYFDCITMTLIINRIISLFILLI